jgi:stearoyl-CoA desaturase (delta-9 desaturase)
MSVLTSPEIKPIHRNFNFFLTLVCYASLIAGIYLGTAQDYFYILCVFAFISINQQAFLHRLAVHRSWDCPNWMKIIGLHISVLALMGPVIVWVAIHREHHRQSDTEKDPHSPLFRSGFSIQFLYGWTKFNYLNAGDLLRKKIYRFYSVRYFEVILVTWCVIMYVIGVEKFFTIWLAGTALSFISTNSVNVLNHGKRFWFGQYRNYDTRPDVSKNDILLGYLHFDGWHNNHHQYPRHYYFGKKWWELDFAGMYIWILATITGYNSSLKK